MGIGVAKDTVKGLELSLKATKEGDVFAMINLVVFYDQGKDFKIDAEKAQFWLDAAGKTGHWYGLIEQGSSLIEGHYGSKVDRTKGIEALQKSVESGNCDALSFLANIYAKGFGLKQDGKQAVRFLVKATYGQGSAKAALILASIYTNGLGDVKADENLADFWGREATKPGFGVDLMSKKDRTEFYEAH